MDDEKLIEMVCNYEFIYNLKHPKYMDNTKKELAWKVIGEQLKQSAVACKQRWQCLRDAYRRALNKRKGKTGQAAKHIKQWKYENEMAFVAPFIVGRKAQDSIENSSDDELANKDNESHAINALKKPNTNIEVDNTPANISDANSTIILDQVLQNESKLNKYTKKSKAVKRKAAQSDPPASASATLMTKLLDDQHKPDPPRGHGELDRFFLNISDTVKKFSPYEQALAKNRIFSMVSEMELQHLAPHSSTVYAFNPSPQSTGTSGTAMPRSPDDCNDHKHFFLP